MYECDKNQVPYCNVKVLKNEIYGNFGPLIEHGPHWINFIILTFISENNRYFKWNLEQNYFIDIRKKGKSKTSHRKNEKKVNLSVLRVNS